MPKSYLKLLHPEHKKWCKGHFWSVAEAVLRIWLWNLNFESWKLSNILRANDITPDNLYLLLTLQECKKDIAQYYWSSFTKKKCFFFWISYTSSMEKGLIIFLMDTHATVVILDKGQLISKFLFGMYLQFSQVTNKKNSTLLLWYLKLISFCSFFGRIEDTKKTLRN